MPLRSAEDWTRFLRFTLQGYDEPLLRLVTGKLCRPRSQWQPDELVDRMLSALENSVLLDRRLKEMSPGEVKLLAVLARSRQNRWSVGNLVELATCLGEADGLQLVLKLLEAGFCVPELLPADLIPAEDAEPPARTPLRSFEAWFAMGAAGRVPIVLIPPMVLLRALQEIPDLPACPGAMNEPSSATVHEADGLDWPLKLTVLWQQILSGPLRRTQQGDFFKRDFDRLQNDPLLSLSPSDVLAPLSDVGFFTVGLALATGLLQEKDAELSAGDFSPAWKEGLASLIAELWGALPQVAGWNPGDGATSTQTLGNPYPSAYLLAVLFLSRLADDAWTDPHEIESWIVEHHPYWTDKRDPDTGIVSFLLSIAYPLRLLQARKHENIWQVRLSTLGRWVLEPTGSTPAFPGFPQTLLVQPNLEILAYRQGLTPDLLVRLTHLATWKGLGAACTLQLEPHSVYHALEKGETLGSIVQLLERYSMKPMPGPVLDLLRTWADKRERLSIYVSAALFEFQTAAELTEALSRGFPAVRLTDRLAVVPNEKDIDYRHFRLTGTRDYLLPPEKCVDIESDGVTLSVDLTRSDLLLESELLRFSEPIARAGLQGRKLYRLSPATVLAGRQNGLNANYLESWFSQRTGQPIPPAAKLLLTGPESPPLEIRRQLVLMVSSPEIADGLQQWPGTRSLILSRLGPTTLAVAEEHVAVLNERLQELGIRLQQEA